MWLIRIEAAMVYTSAVNGAVRSEISGQNGIFHANGENMGGNG